MAAYGRFTDPDPRPADSSHLYPGYQPQSRPDNVRYVSEDDLRATPRYYDYEAGVYVPDEKLEKRPRSRKGSIDSLDREDRAHYSRSRPQSRASHRSHHSRRRSRSRSSSLSSGGRRRPSRGRSVRDSPGRRSRSRSRSLTGEDIIVRRRSPSRDSSLEDRPSRRRSRSGASSRGPPRRRRSISSSPEDLDRGYGGDGVALRRARSADPTAAMMTGAAASYYGYGHGGGGHGKGKGHGHHDGHPPPPKSKNPRQRHAMEVAVGNAARAAFRVSGPDAPQRSIVSKAGKVAGVALTGYLVDYLLDRNAKEHPVKHIGVSMLQGALMDRVIDANSISDITKIGNSEYAKAERVAKHHNREAPF